MERDAALRLALAGVDLSPDEEKLVAWMVRTLDMWTLTTIAGLLAKVRGAVQHG